MFFCSAGAHLMHLPACSLMQAWSAFAPDAWLVCGNSSASAIRKTALRAYRGIRRFFAHDLALTSCNLPACSLMQAWSAFAPDAWLNCCYRNFMSSCLFFIAESAAS